MIGSLTKPWMLGDTQMRRDLRLLCWMLRNELEKEGRTEIWSEVVKLRRLAVRHESGDSTADVELSSFFHDVPLEHLDELLRVLGIFFDFANVSEDLQRERVLRERRESGRLTDSLDARLRSLRHTRKGREQLGGVLKNLEAEFVFTAHPTEAKRQTIRRTLARIRQSLRKLSDEPNRKVRKVYISNLKEDVRALLRTDSLHPHRPEVLEELGRALYVTDTIWKAVPRLVRSIDRIEKQDHSPIRFGCWIGGDRDGHPHVTVDVTRETLRRLRQKAVSFHIQECEALLEKLTMLCVNPEAEVPLMEIETGASGPELEARMARRHPKEHYRRALETIRFRLKQTNGAWYRHGQELGKDLDRLEAAMKADGLSGSVFQRLQNWNRRNKVFGLQLMRLDLRENSRGYRSLIRELLPMLGEDPDRVDADRFEGLWDQTFAELDAARLKETLTERSWDLLAVTRLMQDHAAECSSEGVGVNVISMTHCVGDVYWVLWLHRLIAHWRGTDEVVMPIAPLFETIDDLHRASDMLREILRHPVYREVLDRQGGRQTVMVGYSDSAKDGGYLAACWALYEGQEAMQKVANEEGVGLTCFHGRGGALGRGGGPAARAIQALPPAQGDAHIRMTEQGEVIADRFADPELAHRHMEQILGGLVVKASDTPRLDSDWRACMRDFAAYGREAYLKLFEREGFPAYFRTATPVSCIEALPIGSRPSRRHGAQSLEDLRAIPYTFSWTQSRQLINAFYGVGSAWESLNRKQRLVAIALYREWPFFRSMIDNAELAMTKCDEVIASEYAKLTPDPELGKVFGGEVVKEMERTRKAILSMTERPSLMAASAWLRRSVEIRKPFIDVMNHIQIELIRRQRAAEAEGEENPELQRSLRLSVQGIAAGLRTTG